MGIDILNYLKKSSEETREAYQKSIDLANQIKRDREDHDNRDAHEANEEAAQADADFNPLVPVGAPGDKVRAHRPGYDDVPSLTIPELAERAGFKYGDES